jgi:hypothetical protein
MAGDNRVAGMFWNLGAQKVDGIGLKCLDHFSLFVQGNG